MIDLTLFEMNLLLEKPEIRDIVQVDPVGHLGVERSALGVGGGVQGES